MLSDKSINKIKECIQVQYLEQNYSNTIDKMMEKIQNFKRFLEVFSEDSRFSENIKNFESELENVSINGGRLNLNIISNFEYIMDIIIEEKNIVVNPKNHKIDFFKKLKIINNDEIFNNVFKLDNNGNLKTDMEFCNQAEMFLKNRQQQHLIPYVKSIYININFKTTNVNSLSIPVDLYWNYVSNLFIMYIELVNKIKSKIIDLYILKKANLNQYIKQIIDNYESKVQFKYIPSSVLKMDNQDFISDMEDKEDDEVLEFIEINTDENLKKIKIIGYAGAGKTTTLEYIEYLDAKNYQENKKIPVLISLITVEENESVEKLICRKLNMDEKDSGIVSYLLENNLLNLYLDGVNEISITDYYLKREFLNTLEGFVTSKKYENVKIIVTDRDNDEVSILNNCDTFLVQGMTDNDVNAFIEGNSKPEYIEKIKSVIKNNEEFSKMVMHPIMLKNLITIIECDREIPKDIEELSEVYLNSIIEREIKEKHDPLAQYIHDALVYIIKRTLEKTDWTANAPTSYFKVIDIFSDFSNERNIDIDPESLLNLIKKMGILKEVEFQKYAFLDERFFHIYYYDVISEDE